MAELPAAYLHGIDQFNAGEFFACHETLEELWQQSVGEQRTFLHALIQIAAALHHYQRGNLKGAASVYARARHKFEKLPPTIMGVLLSQLIRELEAFFSAVFVSQSNGLVYPKILLHL